MNGDLSSGGGALLFFADLLFKSLVALCFAGAAAWLLKRRGLTAGARNNVWVCCFAALLALPFLSLVRLAVPPAAGARSLPGRYHVPVPVFVAEKTPVPVAPPPPLLHVNSALLPRPDLSAARGPVRQAGRAVSPPNTARAALAHTLFWLWLPGAVLVLARTVAGLFVVRRLVRGSVAPAAHEPFAELLNDNKRALGVTRRLELRVGRERCAAPGIAASPMTWGWRRPTILLPADSCSWDRERVRAVLLHELAHIARNDWAAQVVLARTVCALYWFHPLVWLAAACLRAEAERACDESVLQAGMSAPDYAGHLLAVARSLRPAATVLPFGRL